MNSPTNPPGLPALAYRAGTYATFMRAMTARLNATLPALATRELDDPSIALLDGWAVIADILTFYQERIANEGFLRTATEKRSLRQLANLTGYAPRPGVAATVFLAYTLQSGATVTLAPGSKAQSVPGPGQSAQTFETADPLAARDTWNVLGLRTTRPQNPAGTTPFYLATVTTNLKPNDLLLFMKSASGAAEHRFVRIAAVEAQPAQNRTKVTLQGAGLVWDPVAAASAAAPPPPTAAAAAPGVSATLLDRISAVEQALLRPASVPPRTPQRLLRTTAERFAPDLDIVPQLFSALHPDVASSVYAALAGAPPEAAPVPQVYAFRVHAAPYGHNAPQPPPAAAAAAAGKANPEPRGDANREALLLEAVHAFIERAAGASAGAADWPLAIADRNPQTLSLDARYDRIAPGSLIAVRTYPADEPVLFTATDVGERSRSDYGLSATTTVVALEAPFFTPGSEPRLTALRDSDVFAASEALQLVDVPIAGDVPDDPSADPTVLELDGIYDGLTPGRWAIVAGTRTDLAGVAGAELVMIAATSHATDPAIPGDTVHTFVTLSTRLAYTYDRASVTVYGNVVRSTHGETRTETIGSGDAAQSRQSFTLKAKPLTFVASPTQSGTQSTLSIAVNGVGWFETSNLDALGPTDRAYTTATTDAGTTVTFGDGVHGARLPSGTENVIATYRVGIGTPGNVDAAAITLLMAKPLGVKAVVNPLPASGGADSESRDAIRANLPTALLALGRLVSLDDYLAVARTFAGVAKVAVASLGSGTGATIVLTLVGPANATIDPQGELATNLRATLLALGDPLQGLDIVACGRRLLLIGASVSLAPGAVWETVEPAIRAALTATFGFIAREFGQPAYRSEASAAIAGVPGVAGVQIERFTSISDVTDGSIARLTSRDAPAAAAVQPLPARIDARGALLGAQLVVLDPSITDTIVLRVLAAGAVS